MREILVGNLIGIETVEGQIVHQFLSPKNFAMIKRAGSFGYRNSALLLFSSCWVLRRWVWNPMSPPNLVQRHSKSCSLWNLKNTWNLKLWLLGLWFCEAPDSLMLQGIYRTQSNSGVGDRTNPCEKGVESWSVANFTMLCELSKVCHGERPALFGNGPWCTLIPWCGCRHVCGFSWVFLRGTGVMLQNSDWEI